MMLTTPEALAHVLASCNTQFTRRERALQRLSHSASLSTVPHGTLRLYVGQMDVRHEDVTRSGTSVPR
eukprot:m.23206 g.23206  ORF g.23206 m.23206 type:complete len:68 (-) comp4062_c0_seq1:47-250(-)